MRPAQNRGTGGIAARPGGFTFIEMMLVFTIISILIVGSMFTLFRPRIVANETSAIASLRTIVTAQNQYAATCGGIYGTLTALSSVNPPYIDDVLGGGRKSGYLFTMSLLGNGSNYRIRANPAAFRKTGSRYFFVDDSGMIRFNLNRPADSTDTPIE